MDLLKDWLGTTIEEELGKVLRWKQTKADGVNSPGQSENLPYRDDGSNLRVTSSKTGVVQIIKFLEYDEPLRATLSDAHSRVNATIAVAAARKYEAQRGKAFTNGSLGGDIQILAFEIVATDMGPRDSRVTLYVKDFKLLGCTGSGQFGIPRPIEVRAEILELLNTLKKIRVDESVGTQALSGRESSRAPSIRSKATDSSAGGENIEDNHPTFATQIPRATVPALDSKLNGSVAKRASAEVSNKDIGNQSTEPSASLNDGLKTVEKSKRGLASLLATRGRGIQTAAPSALRPKDPWTVSTQIKDTANYHLRNETSPTTAPKSVSEGNPPATSRESLTKPLVKPRPKTFTGSASSALLQHKASNRIRSNDTRISRIQQGLLDSADSWLPPEPGHRDPFPSMPISILNSLNNKADLHAQRSRRLIHEKAQKESASEEPKTSTSPVCEEVDSHSRHSESDASLSWPSSPDRNQLPPDSSNNPSVNNSDHANERRSLLAGSAPTFRGLSSASSPSGRVERKRRGPKNSSHSEESYRTMHKESVSHHSLTDTENAVFSRRASKIRPTNHETQSILGLYQHFNPTSTHKSISVPQSRRSSPKVLNPNRVQSNDEGRTKLQMNSTSSDSDMEITVPLPLKERIVQINSAPLQQVPSTYSQSERPFTQVKRTPKVTSHTGDMTRPRTDYTTSPSNMRSPDFLPSTRQTKTESVKSTDFSNSDKPSSRSVVIVSTARTDEHAESQTHEDSTMSEVIDSAPQSKVSQTSSDPRLSLNTSQDRMSDQQSISPSFKSSDLSLRTSPSQATRSLMDDEIQDTKRKVPDFDLPNPGVTKRQKKFRLPHGFDFSQDGQDRPDPSIKARQYRQEFMASRKSSENNTPMHSPMRTSEYLSGVSPPRGNALVPKKITHVKPDSLENCTAVSSKQVPLNVANVAFQGNLPGPGLNVVAPNNTFSEADSHDHSFIDLDVEDVHPGVQEDRSMFHAQNNVMAESSPAYVPPVAKMVGALKSVVDPGCELQDAMPSTPDAVHLRNSESYCAGPADGTTIPAVAPSMNNTDITDTSAPECQGLSALTIVKKPLAQDCKTIFDSFKLSYPEYTGDTKHFIGICKKIWNLVKDDRMEHRSLWDDFIIRHKIEYTRYIRDCVEAAEDPMPYEKYYRTEIEEPKYNSRVITPNILGEILLLGDQGPEAVANPRGRHVDFSPQQFAPLPHSIHEKIEAEHKASPKSRVIIDLTQGDGTIPSVRKESSVPEFTAKSAAEAIRRPLPWTRTGSADAISKRKASQSSVTDDEQDDYGMSPLAASLQNAMKPLHYPSVSPAFGGALIEHSDTVKEAGSKKIPAPMQNPVNGSPMEQKQRTAVVDSSLVNTNAEKQGQNGRDEWWKDPGTPFASFARAYSSIQQGKGNSYAKPEDASCRARVQDQVRSIKKKIDVLAWRI